MQKELGTAGATVGAAILACLFGGLALAIYPGWAAVGRWALKADAPAWVQAVGSVAAIFTAVGVAAWQRHSDRRSAEKTARATMMVVGASTDSKLHSLISAAQALLYEHDHPSYPTAVERAKYFRALWANVEYPSEEQMLLLANALPEDAAAMANGVAAMKRVHRLLDHVASAPDHATLHEDVLLAHYLGAKANLLLGLNYLEGSRAEFLKFAASP